MPKAPFPLYMRERRLAASWQDMPSRSGQDTPVRDQSTGLCAGGTHMKTCLFGDAPCLSGHTGAGAALLHGHARHARPFCFTVCRRTAHDVFSCLFSCLGFCPGSARSTFGSSLRTDSISTGTFPSGAGRPWHPARRLLSCRVPGGSEPRSSWAFWAGYSSSELLSSPAGSSLLKSSASSPNCLAQRTTSMGSATRTVKSSASPSFSSTWLGCHCRSLM